MFDSLRYVKRLEEIGLTREQAEVHLLQILVEVMDSHLATKQDLKDTAVLLRQEMKDLSTELRHEMRELESRMVIKLGGITVIAIGAAAALARLIH